MIVIALLAFAAFKANTLLFQKPQYHEMVPIIAMMNESVAGDILQLGANTYVTPLLPRLCGYRRTLFTIDTNKKTLKRAKQLVTSPHHKFRYVQKWDTIPTQKFYGIVAMTHPLYRHSKDIQRFRNNAYIIITPLFPSKTCFKYTVKISMFGKPIHVLSNFIDVATLLRPFVMLDHPIIPPHPH